jgi:hypothetical protein
MAANKNCEQEIYVFVMKQTLIIERTMPMATVPLANATLLVDNASIHPSATIVEIAFLNCPNMLA